MARNRKPRERIDKGRNFYETSSPFETYEPDASPPKTYGGYTDEFPAGDVAPRRSGSAGGAATDLGGDYAREIMRHMQPEQYDNPRGFPGLSIVTSGSEKSKLPYGKSTHSISHQMESQGKLARTGK